MVKPHPLGEGIALDCVLRIVSQKSVRLTVLAEKFGLVCLKQRNDQIGDLFESYFLLVSPQHVLEKIAKYGLASEVDVAGTTVKVFFFVDQCLVCCFESLTVFSVLSLLHFSGTLRESSYIMAKIGNWDDFEDILENLAKSVGKIASAMLHLSTGDNMEILFEDESDADGFKQGSCFVSTSRAEYPMRFYEGRVYASDEEMGPESQLEGVLDEAGWMKPESARPGSHPRLLISPTSQRTAAEDDGIVQGHGPPFMREHMLANSGSPLVNFRCPPPPRRPPPATNSRALTAPSHKGSAAFRKMVGAPAGEPATRINLTGYLRSIQPSPAEPASAATWALALPAPTTTASESLPLRNKGVTSGTLHPRPDATPAPAPARPAFRSGFSQSRRAEAARGSGMDEVLAEIARLRRQVEDVEEAFAEYRVGQAAERVVRDAADAAELLRRDAAEAADRARRDAADQAEHSRRDAAHAALVLQMAETRDEMARWNTRLADTPATATATTAATEIATEIATATATETATPTETATKTEIATATATATETATETETETSTATATATATATGTVHEQIGRMGSDRSGAVMGETMVGGSADGADVTVLAQFGQMMVSASMAEIAAGGVESAEVAGEEHVAVVNQPPAPVLRKRRRNADDMVKEEERQELPTGRARRQRVIYSPT
ncbi:hypothetical protein BDK51DRAFT_34331 [Blyttiomyces helicus]|uniref:Uncharacterized protein n=1 Tax=Blyttiomyces helicus TaxID=388810 RepID=A0A4P9WDF4_9FUNG|nr:hypothetical protein BDK51DRAFT_34331 [Blyttiomyces helicus]|eukprot:RKO88990.1 hypothetical protein BDK51DRAFT_34331 [Blyttiomyces helicus]